MPLCTLGDDFGPTVRCIRGTYIRMDYINPAQFYFSLSLISLTCGTRTSVVSTTFCHLSPPTPSLSRPSQGRTGGRGWAHGRRRHRPCPPRAAPSPARPHASPSPAPLRRRQRIPVLSNAPPAARCCVGRLRWLPPFSLFCIDPRQRSSPQP
jgi:hypothetical protein